MFIIISPEAALSRGSVSHVRYAKCSRKLAIVCGSEGNFNWWVADQPREREWYLQDGSNFGGMFGTTKE